MTKIGRKGFMLAEVVVVAVVISTVLVTLYTGLNNVSSAYNTRNRYYDVDSLYIAMEVNNILLRNNLSLINTNTALNLQDNDNYVNNFKLFYDSKVGDIINIYITPYNVDKMLTLKNKNSNITFSDYLDYLKGNLDFSDESYNYMIIVERIENKDIDDCYYYALKLSY